MRNTTDIWFAAYLLLKDIKVEKFEVVARGKGKYFFDITDEAWQQHKLDFNNNSELVNYKSATERLKDLLY